VAFIVSTVLGLEMGDVAAVYVGRWTDGDPDTITAARPSRARGGASRWSAPAPRVPVGGGTGSTKRHRLVGAQAHTAGHGR
jgi:hypothetical protein